MVDCVSVVETAPDDENEAMVFDLLEQLHVFDQFIVVSADALQHVAMTSSVVGTHTVVERKKRRKDVKFNLQNYFVLKLLSFVISFRNIESEIIF